MSLSEMSAIEAASLPISELRSHLRLGTGFADSNLQDDLLESYLRAALASIEGKIGLILVPRLFSWQLTDWRYSNQIHLPIKPVTDVNSISIYDRADNITVLDLADFDFLAEKDEPVISLQTGTLPAIPEGGLVEVLFEAGYGPDWSGVPSDLAQAVVLLAAHFYENRSGYQGHESYPMAVNALIERHRPIRLFRDVR